jgi:hypothetical protein
MKKQQDQSIKQYIRPLFISSDSVNEIDAHRKASQEDRIFEREECVTNCKEISFEALKDLKRAIILGEPGCGKSRLIQEYEKSYKHKTVLLKECNFEKELEDIKTFTNNNNEEHFIFLDGLDEVDASLFPFAIKFISQISSKCPNATIWSTCREFYIKGKISLFSQVPEFKYVLIENFDQQRILDFIKENIDNKEIKEIITASINSKETNHSFLSIFKIPRYLTEICKVINENNLSSEEVRKWKRADYFEKAIYSKLETENERLNGITVSKRVLEKLALVMEIKRTNIITRDEFITILDELKSNLSITFLCFSSIEKFIKRLLKETGENIQFENTEFQEYLAAKEILRMKSPEQVLYDFMVNTDFLHIYENWFDVLGYIVELKPNILIFIAELVSKKRNQLSDERILKLIYYADLKAINNEEREQLFAIYYTYFMTHELSINQYADILIQLYTPNMYDKYFYCLPEVDSSIKYYYKIRNQTNIICQLINKKLVSTDKRNTWVNYLKSLVKGEGDHLTKNTALYSLGNISEKKALLGLKKYAYEEANESIEKCYLYNLSKVQSEDQKTIDMFFDGILKNYKEGAYGIMGINNAKKILVVYNRLLGDDQYYQSFFNNHPYSIHYYEISGQLRKVYEYSPEKSIELGVKLLKKIVAGKHYINYSQQELCKEIVSFFKNRDLNLIATLLSFFQKEFILKDMLWLFLPVISFEDLQIIKSYSCEIIGSRQSDEIIQHILHQIKDSNNPDKENIYERGRALYPDEYSRWEKKIVTDKKINPNIEEINKFNINDINECYYAVEIACKLSPEEISILENKEKLAEAITKIIDTINFDEFKVKRTSNAINFNNIFIMNLSKYITILSYIDNFDIIKSKYRTLIIKYIPIYYDYNNNSADTLELLFKIVGDISPREEIELFNWINNRNDDYIYMSPESLFTMIKKFKLYNFESLVKRFLLPGYKDAHRAKKAFDLLMEDFMDIDKLYLTNLFKREKEILRGSLKESANYFLISKFGDLGAAKWRIKFIKENIYKFDLYNFEGSRGVSLEEIEMNNPTMCNCFYENPRVKYKELFLSLIEHSLDTNTNRKFLKYSQYLQTMSFEYFKKLNNKEYIKEVTKLINKHENKHAVTECMPLLRNAQIYITNQINILEVQYAVEIYNTAISSKYIQIKNNQDLFYVTEKAITNIINVIRNEGLYKPLTNETHANEDLIQKTLKVALINEFFKLGFRNVDIIREENLYDDKRTDILIKYGFIGPIMMELKLLHNTEIQNQKKSLAYKAKLQQYIAASYSQYSYYIVFKVRKNESDVEVKRYEKLKEEYEKIDNLKMMLIDCV